MKTFNCLLICSAVIVALVFSGCATTESDMPWASPQSWEGSPAIPGFGGGGGFGGGY